MQQRSVQPLIAGIGAVRVKSECATTQQGVVPCSPADAVLAHFSELVPDLGGQHVGEGHELGGLVGGVAEHVALVTRANFLGLLVRPCRGRPGQCRGSGCGCSPGPVKAGIADRADPVGFSQMDDRASQQACSLVKGEPGKREQKGSTESSRVRQGQIRVLHLGGQLIGVTG